MRIELDEPLHRYWNAQNAEEERRAYADLLSLGFPPSYGESDESVDRLLARYGLNRPIDMMSITRNVSRKD